MKKIFVISIEGAGSNAEKNFINELNDVATSLHENGGFLASKMVAIENRKRSSNRRDIILGVLKRFDIDFSNICDVYVIHDWDREDQYDSLNFTYDIVAEFMNSHGIESVIRVYSDKEDILLNNWENDMFYKITVPPKSEIDFLSLIFPKHDSPRKDWLKEEDFTTISSVVIQRVMSKNIYDDFVNILSEICCNLEENDSSYLVIFRKILEIVNNFLE